MCYRSSWEATLGDMSKETIDILHNQLPPKTPIVFGGIGEPTIAKNFSYAIEKFKDFPKEITTNGIISPKKLHLLCKNFDKLIISVDGIEQDYYNVRKADFSYIDRFLKCVSDYRKKNNTKSPEVEFAFVLTNSNKDTIYSVIDYASKYNVNRILISNLLPQNEYAKDDIFYTEDYNQAGHDYITKVNKYAIYEKRVIVSFPFMELKTDRECFFIKNDYTYVDYEGNVCPCYRFANTYTEFVFGREKTVLKYSFGNINELSLHDIYFSKKYKIFRLSVENQKHPSCADCDLRDGCAYIWDSEMDCLGNSPSCADCLWNRNIVRCT
jgi:radical SAM protein with 4Fe4S-binding SPASM domain